MFASVMIPEKSKPRFPLWQYLNQPLIDSEKPPILNPRRFAQIYHVQLLERCWKKECDAKGQY
jgi:hypothetical protein